MAMEKAGTFQKDPNPTARGAEWSQGQDLEAGLCQSPEQCHAPAALRTRHGLPLAQSSSRTDTSSHTGSRGRGLVLVFSGRGCSEMGYPCTAQSESTSGTEDRGLWGVGGVKGGFRDPECPQLPSLTSWVGHGCA